MAKNPVTWFLERTKRVNDIIWRTPRKEMTKWESFIYRQLRIIFLAARGFSRDKIQLRASALTFYSLLSVIPVAAIAFAIAKGFSLDKNLEQLITEKFASQQEVLNWLLSNARSALVETRGGYMAGVGIVILFWSVMSLLEHIENSFNHIWQIRESRPWYRKFTDYLTIMLIAPIFIILSSSITVFISTELTEFINKAPILAFFKPVISFLIKFAPFFLGWVAMTILYIIMPNTKVSLVPAIISGIIAGTIMHILQFVYIDLQFGITKLNAIYGSFAAVPLFVIWLQSTWIVVLIGAELTYANQNISRYELEFESLNISYHEKRTLVLLIMQLLVRNFATGAKPLSAENIARSINIPVRLTREILHELSSIGLVSIILEHEDDDQTFQPALDINRLTISYVLSRMDRNGTSNIQVSGGEDYDKVTAILNRFDRLIAKSGSNVLIKDI
jgi:membrane protein